MAEENKVVFVVFKCHECGKAFIAQQGSRRKFCADCLVEKITHRKGVKSTTPE